MYFRIISFLIIILINISYAKQPQGEIFIRKDIENPDKYESLAKENYILQNHFKNWELKSMKTGDYSTNEIFPPSASKNGRISLNASSTCVLSFFSVI